MFSGMTGPTCRHSTLRRRPSIWTWLIGARISCQNSCVARVRVTSASFYVRPTAAAATRLAWLVSRGSLARRVASTTAPVHCLPGREDDTRRRDTTTSNLLLITDSYHRSSTDWPPQRHVGRSCETFRACLSPHGRCASH